MKPILDPDDIPQTDPKLRDAEGSRGRKLRTQDTKDSTRMLAAAGLSLADLEARADVDFAAAKLEAEASMARARSRQAQTHAALAPLHERLAAGYSRPSGGG